MTKLTSKLTLLASVLAVACMFTVPAVQAADAEKKAKKEKADLKKYDKNGNGKLDDDEIATMKADMAKKKAEKKNKN